MMYCDVFPNKTEHSQENNVELIHWNLIGW